MVQMFFSIIFPIMFVHFVRYMYFKIELFIELP